MLCTLPKANLAYVELFIAVPTDSTNAELTVFSGYNCSIKNKEIMEICILSIFHIINYDLSLYDIT